MSQSGHKIIQEKELKDFCRQILLTVKVPEEEAEIIADSLVVTDLRGVSTHGVLLMNRYVSLIIKGATRPAAKIDVVNDVGSIALWNGWRSQGQVLGVWAMDKCVEKAQTLGIGMVGVNEGSHYGMCAYYPMKALDKGMIGMTLCTCGPGMAPWGGREAMIGTNPISIAVPCGEEPPVVLDMASSTVSGMKLELMDMDGETRIPPGWALNKEGRVTENLQEALEKMLIMPLGGHKGFGLAMMVDILGGVLTDGGYGDSAGDEDKGPGLLFVAINIDAFRPLKEFKKAMDARIRELKNCNLAADTDRIYMPGEMEFETEIKRRKEGIPLALHVIDDLNRLAESVNVKDRL